MTLDLTESLAPKSDQLDAVELLPGPRTFTITKVSAHNAEQPFNFHLAEFPRVWRPGLSMRRVIVAAWGSKAENYIGQRVTLYCDTTVKFGNDVTGGTRISHMSGIDKPLSVPLLVKRGKSATFTVQPLKAAPARDWLADLSAAGDNLAAIAALGKAATEANAGAAALGPISEAYNRVKAAQS